MTSDDHELLLDTFVDLADTLATDYEVGDFLQLLVDRSAVLMDADTVGVLLEAPDGAPTLAAATSHEMLEIEQREIGVREGPSLEAYRTGRQVVAPSLEDCAERWPRVTPELLAMGVRAACAFPLQLRGDLIGALSVYRHEPMAFTSPHLRLGQALSDVAAVGILQERTVADADRRSAQLQRALDSRVVIEQAKGIVAERHGLTPHEAFTRLRSHARDHGRSLREICQHVIEGQLDV